jgi:GNAT superfamily N-acetyltransferase
MGDDVRLRALDPQGDRRLLERLWEAALGPVWPLLPGALDMIGGGLVAERPGGVGNVVGGGPVAEGQGGAVGVVGAVGAVAVDPAGTIPLLLVHPDAQRRGVGTRLLEAALDRLRRLGAATVDLAGGGGDYIWPGVPDDLPGAVRFFEARGWRWDHSVIDLVADLRRYRVPAGLLDRAAAAGVSLEVAGGRDRAEALAFEAATFPSWLRWFERPDSSVLVARDPGGTIVGSLLFRGPPDATIYAPMLGPAAGTIGCVGVATPARGAGVGSAMVARASELLRDAGTGPCHIGWTQREQFYTRVGYAPWRRYRTARRPIAG